MTKTCVFIDGTNLFAAANAIFGAGPSQLCFKKFKQFLEGQFGSFNVVRINYYTAMKYDEDGNCNIRGLVDFLEYHGYNVISKVAKTFGDRTKGNMDVELTVDALEQSRHYDEVVIVSGDGDFTYLVSALQRAGVRVTVISTREGNNAPAADELVRKADRFIDLWDFKDHVVKD